MTTISYVLFSLTTLSLPTWCKQKGKEQNKFFITYFEHLAQIDLY